MGLDGRVGRISREVHNACEGFVDMLYHYCTLDARFMSTICHAIVFQFKSATAFDFCIITSSSVVLLIR